MERTHTDPTDVALRRLLEQPSYGAQVLIVTARMLEMDSAEPMTSRAASMARNIAADAVLKPLPEAVRTDSLERAERVLPDLPEFPGLTRGEYALHLRAAARRLG